MNEIINAQHKTPIEIALKVDEKGRVSAKNLYDFLEFDPANYARWCKDNLINNSSLEENVDFIGFLHNDENPSGGRPSKDYLITLDVAKEIAMSAHSDKGKAARKYFIQAEKALVISVEEYNLLRERCEMLTKQCNAFAEKMNEFTDTVANIDGRIACIESGTSVSGGRISKWVKETSADVMELAKYCDCTVKEMYSRIIIRMEDMYGMFFQKYFDDYVANHPNEKPVWRIVVIEYYDLKDAFEDAYIKIGREVGLYTDKFDNICYDF